MWRKDGRKMRLDTERKSGHVSETEEGNHLLRMFFVRTRALCGEGI